MHGVDTDRIGTADAQCFEGMKAYVGPKGEIRLFRPDMNMKRLNSSMKRLLLPQFDEEELTKCLKYVWWWLRVLHTHSCNALTSLFAYVRRNNPLQGAPQGRQGLGPEGRWLLALHPSDGYQHARTFPGTRHDSVVRSAILTLFLACALAIAVHRRRRVAQGQDLHHHVACRPVLPWCVPRAQGRRSCERGVCLRVS